MCQHIPAPVMFNAAVSVLLIQLAHRPVPLRTGIGLAHDAVTTSSTQAQAFYDQGLAYLHSYVWLEAARSFNQALTFDANVAMAYTGLSVAYTELNDGDAAREALATARRLAARASERERIWIEARALQMEAERAPTDAVKLSAYRASLERAVQKYPADEEFWLARGMAESGDPGERGQGSRASSEVFYKKALALAPSHFAAHHFLAHAYENTNRPDEALVESETYARMAPNIPHARHMHGHELRRLGRVEEAIAEFQAADEIDSAYLKRESIPPAEDWHYLHNLDLLGTSYQYLGQMTRAEAVLKQSFAVPSSSLEQQFNKREWPVFLIARGRAAEALTVSNALATQASPLVSAIGHIQAGEARLALHQPRAAVDDYNAALRLMKGREGAGLLAAALRQLQGELWLAMGQREAAHGALRQTIGEVRQRPGPDEWIQATFTLESIARASRDAGDWEFAAWAAQQMMEHDPNYAGAHYAAALVAQHNHDEQTARREFAAARRLWANADPDVLKLVP